MDIIIEILVEPTAKGFVARLDENKLPGDPMHFCTAACPTRRAAVMVIKRDVLNRITSKLNIGRLEDIRSITFVER